MEGGSYYQSVGEGASRLGRDPRGLILAGLVGSLIGLFGTTTGTFLTFTTWPIGPLPYTEFTVVMRAVISLASTVGFFLFVLGIYGLSIQYKVAILSLVAIIEAGLRILNEAMSRFLGWLWALVFLWSSLHRLFGCEEERRVLMIRF